MAFTPIDADSVGNPVLIHPRGGYTSTLHVINTTAAAGFVQFFDAAAANLVTLGTTIPRYVLAVGTSGVAEGNVGGNIVWINGIVVAVTTTPAGGTTASGPAHVRVWVE